MTIAISLTAIILISVSFLPLLSHSTWWVRVWDFPRVQITLLSLATLCSVLFVYQGFWYQWLIAGLLAAAVLWQAYKILPFTPLYRQQVITTAQPDPDRQISMVIANVLMTNTQYHRLRDVVERLKPDLLLTLETNKQWERELQPLEKLYPHVICCPQENLYGMHLYSQLEMKDCEINFLIEEDVPSIQARLTLRSGDEITIHCLHPAPPSPTENHYSSERDAELITVGRTIKKQPLATIATGDLNDVAWSDTTVLFRKISGLMDPRIGRGLFNSFHADYHFLRWPLDHVFHSDDFSVVKLQRLKHIGSDHFPLYCTLQYSPAATEMQQPPTANSDDKQLAKQKVAEGRKNPSDF